MKVYWIWLLFNISPWIFALAFFSVSMVELLWRLLGVAIYFVIFFVMPLVTNKPVFTMILLSLNTCIAVITLFPSHGDGFNPFLILILSLLIGEA